MVQIDAAGIIFGIIGVVAVLITFLSFVSSRPTRKEMDAAITKTVESFKEVVATEMKNVKDGLTKIETKLDKMPQRRSK
ncbi:MAG: hypothetical protein WCW35_14635 [Bacteroidota bacterium]|jgi:hypothetical protein